MDRVLDLLHKVKYEVDGSLTFRRSCAHGVCGSDAMLINGRNRLACKIRVEQLGRRRISVAPLPGLPVIKDLVVDMDGFFAKYRSVQPFLITDGPPPTRERRQSPEERARYDDTTKCILCAACTSSCPSFWAQPSYVGPAAIVQAHRFIFDSRDEGADERLEILADQDGRVALPDDLQLHGCLSPGDRGHPGDPRGLGRDRRASALIGLFDSIEPESAGLRLIVRTDGAAKGNPGPASSGAVLIDADQPGSGDPLARPLATISEYLGIRTNNVAEYVGVVRALALALELGATEVDMLLDSKLIVEQVNGRWRVKDAKIAPLHAEVRASLGRFRRWTANHVPRAQNSAADALANEAIDRVRAGGPPVVVRRPDRP